MIVKRIENPKQHSSKASRLGGLIDYIAEAKKDASEKSEYTFTTGNFYSESWQAQRAEMIALSVEAIHSSDPVDHWLLSWKEGEIPTEAHCREAVAILKRHLGMRADHLTMCSLHCNTDNYHLHIVLNRVDPESLRVAGNGWCLDKAHRAVAEIVSIQGWESEAHARYAWDENGKLLRRSQSTEHSLKARVLDRENLTGEKSCERLAIEKAGPVLAVAQNWAQVHTEMARIGMRYEPKGSGAVIWVGELPVKASIAGREFSKTRMEERLGPFEASTVPSSAQLANRASEPLHRDMPTAWAKHHAIQADRHEKKEAAFLNLRMTHRAERETLLTTFREERNALYRGGSWTGDALNVARGLLAAEHARRKAMLQERHGRERDELRKRFPKRQTYEQYLIEQGEDQLAKKWRFRNACNPHGTIRGEGEESFQIRDIRDFVAQMKIAKNGQVTAIEYRGKSSTQISFSDRGKRIDVLQITDEATVLASLQLASQKWGTVAIDGPMEFKLLCAKVAAQHGVRIMNSDVRAEMQAPNQVPTRDVGNPYEAHKTDILSCIDVRNPSRLDWMIAIRMRVTGHSKEAIGESLKRNAPSDRKQEERDWFKYAQRTAQAAFGPRGDRECQQCRGRESIWKRIEGRESSQRVVVRNRDQQLGR